MIKLVINILWIEDENIQTKLYKKPFEKGYNIKFVENKENVIKSLKKNNYDIVILDLIIESKKEEEHKYNKNNEIINDVHTENLERKYKGLPILKEILLQKFPKDRVIIFTIVSNQNVIKELRQLGIKYIFFKLHFSPVALKKKIDELFLRS